MLLQVPDVLAPEQLRQFRETLDAAQWQDGRATAGVQSARVKNNLQLPEDSPVARQLGERVVQALGRSPLFMAAALPARIYPPLFNRHEGGGHYGFHFDNAIRDVRGAGYRVRADISATLFLSAPDEYEGGELVIEDSPGGRSVKLPAGHMILYPATSLHQVTAVTRGARIAAFFWIQSVVREEAQRALLFDLDTAIQGLSPVAPDHPALMRLTGVYHNLMRRWAEP